jgi:site-specific recombinase XerD
MEWLPSNPFEFFECKHIPTDREVLTQDDLDKLYNKEITIQRLAEVRDVFLFCCYTGFAYNEVEALPHNAVQKGIDGEKWLSINRVKTGTLESVMLLPLALEIIEKYREHKYCQVHNKLLPVNSNQRYNAYLKELADICGIKSKLTTHIARHTFATTVTLANGVPIETVSALLGHKDIKTTQIYAKVVKTKVSQDMKALRNVLNQKAQIAENDAQQLTGS